MSNRGNAYQRPPPRQDYIDAVNAANKRELADVGVTLRKIKANFNGVLLFNQAEEADFTANLHGNWTMENAKSRLHQFLQMHRIRADYSYKAVGPDHNK